MPRGEVMSEQAPSTELLIRREDATMAYIDEAAFPHRADYVAALRQIATVQRRITICFAILAMLTFACPMFTLYALAGGFLFIPWVAAMMQAMHYSTIQIFVASLGMLIPLVNLIILAGLATKASSILRRGGLTVGLMGVHPRDLKNLE
ncbi:MAG: hypothetical protein AMXMBFR13_50310 [Phycisphaerae bacterium]